jgi:hypothetical protein
MRIFTLCVAVFTAVASAQGPPFVADVRLVRLDRLLAMGAAHVAEYGRGLSNVVAQEDYQQIVRSDPIQGRRTRADMIMFDVTGDGWWVPFRDVFEVDGRTVRERDDRLARLAAVFTSDADAVAQARVISEESARFNLGGFDVSRTINTPMTTLAFLAAANHSRSTFRVDGTDVIGGVSCSVVSFTETRAPSLIESVLRAELQAVTTLIQDRGTLVRGRIVTTYAEHARLGIWVPVRMDEHYDIVRGPVTRAIDGRADYSNFRRFGVTTSEQTR